MGIYLIGFAGVIGLLEFQVPREAYAYGSFLFSFIGRGVFYTFAAASMQGHSIIRGFAAFIVFVIGVFYIALEAVPSISPPDNMNPEGVSIPDDEDII